MSSVKSSVYSVERRVWSESVECKVQCVKCAVCGVSGVKCVKCTM